jgi:tRNA A-37 threonylcarbamoyl transferase component Bud32
LIFGELGLAPKVISEFSSSLFEIEKYDITLTEYYDTIISDSKTEILDEIYSIIDDKISKMYSLGWVHSDLHSSNIMLKMEGDQKREFMNCVSGESACYVRNSNDLRITDIVFIDFELSFNVYTDTDAVIKKSTMRVLENFEIVVDILEHEKAMYKINL